MTGVLPLINAIAPLVIAYIKKVRDERGTMPTDEEVIQHLMNDADAVIAISDAWLAAHPVQDIPPENG